MMLPANEEGVSLGQVSPAAQQFKRYKVAFVLTDVLMLAYWATTAAMALGWLRIPAELLYSGYHDRVLVAWNWSFLPLDLIFSFTGLAAVLLHRRGHAAWRDLAIISAVCTSVAGLMAISFWALQGEFDPAWWVPNALIMAWPVLFLAGLLRDAEPAPVG